MDISILKTKKFQDIGAAGGTLLKSAFLKFAGA